MKKKKKKQEKQIQNKTKQNTNTKERKRINKKMGTGTRRKRNVINHRRRGVVSSNGSEGKGGGSGKGGKKVGDESSPSLFLQKIKRKEKTKKKTSQLGECVILVVRSQFDFISAERIFVLVLFLFLFLYKPSCLNKRGSVAHAVYGGGFHANTRSVVCNSSRPSRRSAFPLFLLSIKKNKEEEKKEKEKGER